MLKSRALPLLALLGVLAVPSFAQVSLTTLGVAATQNFDTLATTGTANAWADNSTLPGWYSQFVATPTNPTTYRADAGTSNTGAIYSYGTGTATERSFGSVASGTPGNILNAIRLVNNTGATIGSLDLSLIGEQWRNGGNAAAQQLDFQYQVAAAGTITDANTPSTGWTDFNSLDFVSPIVGATAAALDGNAAANRTALAASLTVTVNAGEEIWLRWLDINDTGNDHGLSIDDFSVTPQGSVAMTTLSINDVAVTEGNAGTVLAMFTVSLSAPAGAGGVTFDIATADGVTNPATLADNDYAMNSLVGQVIPTGNSTFAFSVTVNGDMAVEPNETFLVNVTNVVGATLGDGQGVGTINNDDVALTPIHDIQGPGAASPLSGTVSTRGIVTGVRTNGFFIQEPDATVDADPLTSEGILVFTSSAPPAAAVVGALVQVTGTIAEFVPSQDPLQPPLTELTSPTVVQISTGNPLPAAIPLTPTFPDPAGAHDQLERLEGMRVSVASLTVSGPTLGNVNEPMNTATSSGVFYGVVTGVARPFREAGIPAPDPAPAGTIPPIPRFDSNPERIRVDSDSIVVGQFLNVGFGQTVSNLVGPLDYTFRTYSINPEATPTVSGTATEAAVSTPTNMEFTIASYNLERFFDTTDEPGISDPVLTPTAFNNRLQKASRQIRNFLKTPDILGIVEIENLATLQGLATQINTDAALASQPDPMYQAFLVEGNDIGGIDVGFLVKTAPVFGATPRVSVTSVTQELDGTLFVNPDTSTETLNDRPPLRLNAVVNHPNASSYPVTVIVNHLRSLNSANGTGPGSGGWATDGDRVRAKRQKQAEDLANLVQARQIADPMERIVLIGDFNAFEFNDGLGDSMGVIGGTPTPDNQTVVPGDGIDLVNPDFTNLFSTTAAADRYSFIFDGNAQSLDHILVNQALVNSTMARREEHARINADFPATDRNDAMSNRRLADHDPIVAFFSVPAFPVELMEFSID